MPASAFSLGNLYNFVGYPIAFMLLVVSCEAAYYRLFLKEKFDWHTGVTTTAIGVVEMLLAMILYFSVFSALGGLQAYSIFHWKISSPVVEWAVYFVAAEFIFYIGHYCSHHVRWFWADHSVHHSSRQINLFAGNRNGWTGLVAGAWIFTIPFLFLGFEWKPLMTGLSIILSYQFYLHTEIIRGLGPLEYILNTPSRHRVHHGMNEKYFNKNFSGIFLLFDWIFGTLEKEDSAVKPVYGYIDQPQTRNPVTLVFFEWKRLFADTIATFRRGA